MSSDSSREHEDGNDCSTNSVVFQISQSNLDSKYSFLLSALIWDFNNIVVMSIIHGSCPSSLLTEP